MSDYRELLLGSGNNHAKKIWNESGDGHEIAKEWRSLTTLDIDEACNPDIVFDLQEVALHKGELPFDDETFDEVHAYDVLEHLGSQGDYENFFHEFGEYWRILKKHGIFCASVPAWDSVWAWGDPGHTRVLSEGSVVYLSQREYKLQIGKTAMTDYRKWWKRNFDLVAAQYEDDGFAFVIRKT